MCRGRSGMLTRALLAFAVAVGLLAMHHLVVHSGAMHGTAMHGTAMHSGAAIHGAAHSGTSPAVDSAATPPTAAHDSAPAIALAMPPGGHTMIHDCPAALAAALILVIALISLGVLDDRRLSLRAELTRLRRIGRGPPPTTPTSQRLSALSILRV